MTRSNLQGTTRWFGTQAESFAFLRALANNCACEVTREGVRLSTCEPHLAFLREQRWLDRLICLRRCREQLVREEMRP